MKNTQELENIYVLLAATLIKIKRDNGKLYINNPIHVLSLTACI